MKILKVLGIFFVAFLFSVTSAFAITEPTGNFNVYPSGQTHKQTFVIHITSNPQNIYYRAFAECIVGSTTKPNIYGSWHNGKTSSQTPDCNSKYGSNAYIQFAGFYFSKSQNIQQGCYFYGGRNSGDCPITP